MRIWIDSGWKEFEVRFGNAVEEGGVSIESVEVETECSRALNRWMYRLAVLYEPEENVSVLTGFYINDEEEEDLFGFRIELTPEEISTYASKFVD